MHPYFFSATANPVVATQFTDSLDKLIADIEAKKFSECETSFNDVKYKINVFISEFRSLQNINPDALDAFKSCCSNFSKLDAALNKTSLVSAEESGNSTWIWQAKETVKLALEQLKEIDACMPSTVGNEAYLLKLVKLATALDFFIEADSNVALANAQQDKLALCCEHIKEYFSLNLIGLEGDPYKQTSDALAIFINTQSAENIKVALAQYIAICLKIYKFKTQISNLKDVYDELERLQHTNVAFKPYMQLKQAELIEIHLKFAHITTNCFDDFFAKKQRQILLPIILDPHLDDVELKAKAHYLLAHAFMKGNIDTEGTPQNCVMAKKYFQYVATHKKNSVYGACAAYYLGFLHIFALGKKVNIDMQAGAKFLENALQNEFLPETLANKARRLQPLVKLNDGKISYEISNPKLHEVREKLLQALDLYLEGNKAKITQFCYMFFDQLGSKLDTPTYTFEEMFSRITSLEKSNQTESDKIKLCRVELSNIASSFKAICRQSLNELDDIAHWYPFNYKNVPKELFLDLNPSCENEFLEQFQEMRTALGGFNIHFVTFGVELLEQKTIQKFEGQEYAWEFKSPNSNLLHEYIQNLQAFCNEDKFIMEGINQVNNLLYELSRKIAETPKNLNNDNRQKELIRLINYRKMILQNAEKFNLSPLSEISNLCSGYHMLKDILPEEYQSQFFFEAGSLALNAHKIFCMRNSNQLSSDLVDAIRKFIMSLHVVENEGEKLKLLEKITDLIEFSADAIKKIIAELQSDVCLKTAQEFDRDLGYNISYVRETVLKFLSSQIEFKRFQGKEEEANVLYKLIMDQMPISYFEVLQTQIVCSCCTGKPKTTRFQKKNNTCEQEKLFLSLLPSSPAFLPYENMTFKKVPLKSGKSKTGWQTWEQQAVFVSAKQEAKQAALDTISKQEHKASLKKLKSTISGSTEAQIAPVVTMNEVPSYIYISNKGMETFQKIFTPQNQAMDVSLCQHFDACNFRTDLKIKHEDVVILIVELGGRHIPKEGKGSHEKCLMTSLQNRDRFELNGKEIALADFKLLEKNQTGSDMMILTNVTHLKEYQIRQLCHKLIKLNFTPQTVRAK